MRIQTTILAIFLGLSLSCAQAQDYPTSTSWTEAEMEKYAQRMQIDLDSRHMKRILGELPASDWKQDAEKLEVLKLTKGKKGIPFPSKAEVEKARGNSQPASLTGKQKEILNKSYARNKATLRQHLNKRITLPRCQESATNRLRIGEVRSDGANRPSMDLLFIQAESSSKLTQELNQQVFGQATTVVPYYRDKQLGTHKMAASMEVKCLPTRFRSTSNYIFTDTGKNALKNYDDDYHGSGRLHPLMQK